MKLHTINIRLHEVPKIRFEIACIANRTPMTDRLNQMTQHFVDAGIQRKFGLPTAYYISGYGNDI